MSAFEAGRNTQTQQQQGEDATPTAAGIRGQDEDAYESGSGDTSINNNSIMGKVKLRVSSILPGSLGKWFSPSSQQQNQQQQQHNVNGNALMPGGDDGLIRSGGGVDGVGGIKRKRPCRRIELEAAADDDDAAAGFDVDDGANAEGLDYEEVALADNIAEHDLAAEDEQTRRNEYSVSLLRKRHFKCGSISAALDVTSPEEYDDDDEEEYEDELPIGNDCIRGAKVSLREQQPLPKRRRLSQPMELNSPQRRPQLLSSTPAISGVGGGNAAQPNRLTYTGQRQRDPAYSFFVNASAAVGKEAAMATSGDLPYVTHMDATLKRSTRRALVIPRPGQGSWPSYRRPPLDRGSVQAAAPWRTSTAIAEANEQPEQPEQEDEEEEQQQLPPVFLLKRNNNNNNNNNVIKRTHNFLGEPLGALDTHSECESNESQPLAGRGNLDFYGNLQSRKSIFNASSNNSSAGGIGGFGLAHHNSTLSLNSLSRRRHFNASIYGSTSALSDSRLLANCAGSPFYKGRTSFGGSAANNRLFATSLNSRSSSPRDALPAQQQQQKSGSYGLQPVTMLPKQRTAANNSSGTGSSLSNTASRILNLLDSYSTPLIDAKKMASTLREHQQRRQRTPYMRPRFVEATGAAAATKTPTRGSSALLVPTMQQLLQRRRLHKVTLSARDYIYGNASKTPELPAMAATTMAATTTAATTTAPTRDKRASAAEQVAVPVALPVAAAPAANHTNKMRSRLTHHTRKELRAEYEEPPLALDLPHIAFPDMPNAPKFDIVIAALPVAPSLPAPSPSQSQSQQRKLEIVANNNFNFRPPLLLNGGSGDLVPPPRQPNPKPKLNFCFTAPLSLSKPLESHAHNGMASKSPRLHASGSVLDILQSKAAATPAPSPTPTPTIAAIGFGKQFKKSANDWECNTCMVRNKLEASKCIACEMAKPAGQGSGGDVKPAAAVVPAISSSFGDRFKQPSNAWECDACMLSNKAEASKCIACETPAPAKSSQSATATATTTITEKATISNSFGNAFKPKANTWECSTCLIVNQASDAACLACQTPNPNSSKTNTTTTTTTTTNVSSSTSIVNSSSGGSSFKFGFAPSAVTVADAGFQRLVASQKAASWDCDACMAQNDLTRQHCICCEQRRPGAEAESKFSFGSSTATTAASTAAAAATKTTPSFTFGFGGNAAQEEQQQPQSQPPSFVFGKDVADSTKPESSTVGSFKFGAPAAASTMLQQQSVTATAATTTTTAAAAAATTTTTPASVFKFGIASSSTVSSSTPSTTNNNSSSIIATATTTAPTVAAAAAAAPAITVSSTTQPLFGGSHKALGGFGFGSKSPSTVRSSGEASTNSGTSSGTSSSSDKDNSEPAGSSNAFYFGQPQAQLQPQPQPPTNTNTADIAGKGVMGVSSIFGNAGGNAVAKSAAVSSSNATATAMATTFSFGSAGSNPVGSSSASASSSSAFTAPTQFGFGAAAKATTASAATNAATFSWSNPASNGGGGGIANTTVSSSTVAPIFGSSSNIFGSNTAAATTTPAPTASVPLSSVFGNVSNPFNQANSNSGEGISASAAATTTTTPLANIFNLSNATTTVNTFATGNGGGITSSSSSMLPKPSFNFGSSANAATANVQPQQQQQQPPPAGGFNFSFGPAKPFNFTGSSSSAAAPQAFNFTANAAAAAPVAATPAAAATQVIGNAFAYERPIQFDDTAYGCAMTMPTSNQVFNFTAVASAPTMAQQMQSTPNAAAPFQFNAGAPATPNIFAFNAPAGGSATQNAQMVRRKIRAPMRRLPPR